MSSRISLYVRKIFFMDWTRASGLEVRRPDGKLFL